jgi:hypothetical protein
MVFLMGSFFYKMHFHQKQINNLILFQAYETALQDYYKNHAAYPATLSDIFPDVYHPNCSPGIDYWNHALLYEQRSSNYILVSYGRNGKPDGLDYWKMRDAVAQGGREEHICGRWNADQVLSDVGWVRVCGK